MVALRSLVYTLVSTLCLPHLIVAAPPELKAARNTTNPTNPAITVTHSPELENLEPRILPVIAGIAGGFVLRSIATGLLSAGAGYALNQALNGFFGDDSEEPSSSPVPLRGNETAIITGNGTFALQIPEDFTPQRPTCHLNKDHLVAQSYIIGRKLAILRQLSADKKTDISEQDVFEAQQSHWTAMHIVDAFVLGNEIGLPLQDEGQLRGNLSSAMLRTGQAMADIQTQDSDVQKYIDSIRSDLDDGELSLKCT